MKVTLKTILVLSTVALLVMSCKSREEKALETIKAEMYKTLSDFDSYQPIETTFDSLENNVYGDTSNIEIAKKIPELMQEGKSNYEGYQEAINYLKYWGDHYYLDEAKFEMKKYEIMSQLYDKDLEACAERFHSYKKQLKNVNLKEKGEFYGWRVTHKFRATTKGGKSSTLTYTFFMDKKCEIIYTYFDETFSWEKCISCINLLLEFNDN